MREKAASSSSSSICSRAAAAAAADDDDPGFEFKQDFANKGSVGVRKQVLKHSNTWPEAGVQTGVQTVFGRRGGPPTGVLQSRGTVGGASRRGAINMVSHIHIGGENPPF